MSEEQYIQVPSTVFPGLIHYSEIDLTCYEVIDYVEFERELETNAMPNINIYPKSIDVWKCCGENFILFSKLIDHIEHNHLLYR